MSYFPYFHIPFLNLLRVRARLVSYVESLLSWKQIKEKKKKTSKQKHAWTQDMIADQLSMRMRSVMEDCQADRDTRPLTRTCVRQEEPFVHPKCKTVNNTHTHTQDERIHFSSHTGSDSNMRMQCREARRSKQTRQQPHQASPLPQSKEYVREEEIDFTYMIVWLDTKRKKCWFDGRNSDANMNRGFSPGGLGTWTNPLKQNLRIRQQPALIFFSPKRDRKERVRKRETQNTCSSLYCIDAG